MVVRFTRSRMRSGVCMNGSCGEPCTTLHRGHGGIRPTPLIPPHPVILLAYLLLPLAELPLVTPAPPLVLPMPEGAAVMPAVPEEGVTVPAPVPVPMPGEVVLLIVPEAGPLEPVPAPPWPLPGEVPALLLAPTPPAAWAQAPPLISSTVAAAMIAARMIRSLLCEFFIVSGSTRLEGGSLMARS